MKFISPIRDLTAGKSCVLGLLLLTADCDAFLSVLLGETFMPGVLYWDMSLGLPTCHPDWLSRAWIEKIYICDYNQTALKSQFTLLQNTEIKFIIFCKYFLIVV